MRQLLRILLLSIIIIPSMLRADLDLRKWDFFGYRSEVSDIESNIDEYNRNYGNLSNMLWLEKEGNLIGRNWLYFSDLNYVTIMTEEGLTHQNMELMRVETLDDFLKRYYEVQMERFTTESLVGDFLATKEKENQGIIPEIDLPTFGPEWWQSAFGKGGKLDVSGHQRLAVGAGSYKTNAPADEYGSNEGSQMGMKQELKVLAKGTIGTKLSILLDYDSTRQFESKNKVQLVYTGEEDEIIQEIAAGDIELGITGPEFLSYNVPHKGLFGARTRLKVGGWEFFAIASLEHGERQQKEFTGQNQVDSLKVLDLEWVKNQYFFISCFPDSLTKKAEVDSVYLYASTTDSTGSDPGYGTAYLDPADTTGTEENPFHRYTGYWKLLQRGTTMDYIVYNQQFGLIYLTYSIDPSRCLAAVYRRADTKAWVGDKSHYKDLVLKMIKPPNSMPPVQGGMDNKTWEYQHMGVYSLNTGGTTLDASSVTLLIGYDNKQSTQYQYSQGGKTFLELLGMADSNGKLITDYIDTRLGHIHFPPLSITRNNSSYLAFMPFMANVLTNKNPDAYFKKDAQTTDSKYILFLSYSSSGATYNLGKTNIIEGSELVYINDVLLVRDKDYTINYAAGIVTLYKAPGVNDKIKILFEFADFMAESSKALMGFRTKYNFLDESSIATTWMYENTTTIEDKPEIGSEPQRISAGDVDLALKFKPDFMTEYVNNIPFIRTNTPSEFTLTAEIARNFPNPNTKNFGYIDDMESVKNTYPLGIRRESWYLGSMDASQEATDTLYRSKLIYWNLTKARKYVYDNYSGTKAGDEAVDLLYMYNVTTTDGGKNWCSVMKCLEPSGTDFSEKRYLIIWLKSDVNNGALSIDLGGYMNEDATGDGKLNDERKWRGETTQNPNWNVDTDDVGLDMQPDSLEFGYNGHNDPHGDNYYFNEDKAKSWLENQENYKGINGTEYNRHYDTEDLDGNGVLDRQNHYFTYTINLGQSQYNAGTNKAGYTLYKIPLRSGYTSKTGAPDLSYIRYARMRLTGQTRHINLVLADLYVEGAMWLNDGVVTLDSTNIVRPTESFEVTVKNTRDNSDYRKDPPPGIDPGVDENGDVKQEQSLCLTTIQIKPGHYGLTHKALPSPLNLLGYRKFSFYLHGKDDKALLFIRVGSDSLNYYEYRCKSRMGWQRLEFLLKEWSDLKKAVLDSIGQTKVPTRTGRGPYYLCGLANLNNISYMAIGVENDERANLDTELWVDDIHLREAIVKSGYAKRVTIDNKWSDLFEVKGDIRQVDGHFYSLGQDKPTEIDENTYTTSEIINLDRFLNPTWRFAIPVAYNFTLKKQVPYYKTGTDIELDKDERDKEKTISKETTVSAKIGKTGPSRTFLETYFLNNLTAEFAYLFSNSFGPTQADTLRTYDYKIKYAFARDKDPTLNLKWFDFHYVPTRFTLSTELSHKFGHTYEIDPEAGSSLRDKTMDMKLIEEFGLETGFIKNLTTGYGIQITRDRKYFDELLGMNIGPEIGRTQVINTTYTLPLSQFLQPGAGYTTTYREDHRPELRQTNPEGKDVRNVDNDNTLRLDASFALSRFFYWLAGSQEGRSINMDEYDEVTDSTSANKGKVEPGSPKWIALSLGKVTTPIMPIRGSYSINKKTEVYGLYERPPFAYQMGFGKQKIPEEGEIRRDDKETVWTLGSGFQPIAAVQFQIDYENRKLISHYLDNPEGAKTITWPRMTLNISDLNVFFGLKKLMEEMTLGSSYAKEWNLTGQLDSLDNIIPTKDSDTYKMEPRGKLSMQFGTKFKVGLEDDYTKTIERTYSGSFPITDTRNHKDSIRFDYSFSKPNGFYIPIIPFVYKIRVRFKSDLNLGIELLRETTLSVQNISANPISDKVKYSVKPSASYNFQVITAGLQGEYGIENDRAIANGKKTIQDVILWMLFYF